MSGILRQGEGFNEYIRHQKHFTQKNLLSLIGIQLPTGFTSAFPNGNRSGETTGYHGVFTSITKRDTTVCGRSRKSGNQPSRKGAVNRQPVSGADDAMMVSSFFKFQIVKN
jgi:hypothetical protein